MQRRQLHASTQPNCRRIYDQCLLIVSQDEAPRVRRIAYTIAEAADMLGVSRDLLLKLCRNDELTHVKLGRRYLVPVHVLDELVKGQVLERNAERSSN